MRVRMKIGHKLGGAFAAITLAIVALVTVVVSVVVAGQLQAEAFKRLNNDLDVTIHTFEYFSADARKTARMLAQNATLVADLTHNDRARVAHVSEHLHGLSQESIVSVYDRDGKLLYDGGDVATLHNPRRHPAALGLALAGEESKGITVLPTGALAIEATVPVLRGTEIVGAVRVGTKLDDAFVDQLKSITGLEVGIAEGVEVGIAEGNSLRTRWLAQTIMGDKGRLATGVPSELVREARQKAEPVRRSIEINGVTYLAAMAPLYGPLGDFVGTLFVGESAAPLQRAVTETIGMIVLLALALGLIGAIAVKWLAKTITEPIRQLASQTHCIAKGQLDMRVEVHSGDELEQLANAFNKMCDALVEMQYRDQNANPLTKLPGNLMIEAEVDRRLKACGEEVAVLYLDLDHFKAFNDKYGFEQGDRVLKLTADILKSICGENAPHNPNFVGHIGGDDFIVVTKTPTSEDLCQVICTEFDRRVKELYPTEDRDRGHIISVDRKGNRQKFPLCSISIALVDNESRPIADFLELSSVAAEVKKFAKSLPGSSYARDRRGDRDAAFLKDW